MQLCGVLLCYSPLAAPSDDVGMKLSVTWDLDHVDNWIVGVGHLTRGDTMSTHHTLMLVLQTLAQLKFFSSYKKYLVSIFPKRCYFVVKMGLCKYKPNCHSVNPAILWLYN